MAAFSGRAMGVWSNSIIRGWFTLQRRGPPSPAITVASCEYFRKSMTPGAAFEAGGNRMVYAGEKLRD